MKQKLKKKTSKHKHEASYTCTVTNKQAASCESTKAKRHTRENARKYAPRKGARKQENEQKQERKETSEQGHEKTSRSSDTRKKQASRAASTACVVLHEVHRVPAGVRHTAYGRCLLATLVAQ